jgi:hypothetical protein
MGYGLGLIPGKGKRFFLSSLHSNGYRGLYPRFRDVRLTSHLYIVPRSKIVELYLHYPYVFMACWLIQ